MKMFSKAFRAVPTFYILYTLWRAAAAEAATRYVWQDSSSPAWPYVNWAAAAHTIQEAVDAAQAGDKVLVAGGVYDTGGRPVDGTMTNRVVIDKAIMVESLMGPEATVIQGYQVPITTNGDGAIRCVYLADGATLSGFTLTKGATRCSGGEVREQSGGGLWCESFGTFATNCILAGNSASYEGGGVSAGILNDCELTGNSARTGGGASGTMLDNCTLSGNSANEGGGAYGATLLRCTLARNSARSYAGAMSEGTMENCLLTGNSAPVGGGAAWSELRNCTLTANSAETSGGGAYNTGLRNCILYYNTAPDGANYDAFSALNYCCSAPLPTNGIGNLADAPQFVDYAGGNLRLQSHSPCINGGNNAQLVGGPDLDGNPRIVGGTVDIGVYEFQSPSSRISYAWLQQYSLPTDGSSDFTDPDLDGMNNWQEWVADTNPTNAASCLRLVVLSNSPPVAVAFSNSASRVYTLLCSTNLNAFQLEAAWLPVRGQTDVYGNGDSLTLSDTNPLPAAFYRVSARLR